MQLIIEPDDGVAPLLTLIKSARERVDMAVFRFDHREIEKALKTAVSSGANVSTLIADSNRGGEKQLRKLEMRFLDAGITVSRSANDLIRHHSKIIVVDQKVLAILSFNFTHMDIDRSRGFGIITENAKWVAEADKLLQADMKRTDYVCEQDTFVISPVNARKILGNFLSQAQKQLLIYDPKISDRAMIRILKDRAKAGVEIRVIGQTKAGLEARMLSNLRLHTRTIIRDAEEAFIGSQSLRATELDSRREAGLIVSDASIVRKLIETFELDWSSGTAEKPLAADPDEEKSPDQDAEIAIKVLVEELHPVADVVKKAMESVVAQAGEEILQDGKVKETVKKVVKKVVKQAVKEAIES